MGFSADAAFTVRALIRRPLYSLVIVMSLVLAVGLNAAVFSLLNALLLRPVPGVEEPDRVVSVYTGIAERSSYLPVSYPNFVDLRDQSRQLADVAAYQATEVALGEGEDIEVVTGSMVTASYFGVLGISPARGRFFTREEGAIAGGARVVVLGDELWHSRFNGDPAVVGRAVTLNGSPFTVVGIAPPGFRGVNLLQPAELWVSVAAYREVFSAADLLLHRGDQVLQVVGRLGPDASVDAAALEVGELGKRLVRAYPEDNRDQRLITVPLSESALPPKARERFVETGLFLVAAAGLLGLIACVNVANLVLVRTVGRTSEMGIRLTQGASWGRLTRLVLVEVLTLVAVAGCGSLLLLPPVVRWLWSLRPPFLSGRILARPFDLRVAAFGLALALIVAALACLAPVLRVLRSDPRSLFDGGTASGPARRRGVFSSSGALVSFQIALAVVALVCASSFFASFWNAREIDPGFDTESLVTVTPDFQARRADPAEVRATRRRILTAVSGLANVSDAAFAENRLLAGARVAHRLSRSTGSAHEGDGGPFVASNRVGPHYFRTVGTPLLRGREIDDRDRIDSAPVAVVNETLATELWPQGTGLGEHLFIDQDPTPVEVVGVVGDTALFSLGETPRPCLYLPAAQSFSPTATLNVRTRGGARASVDTIRRAVRAAAPDLPLTDVQTVRQILDQSVWWRWAAAVLLALFSVAATLLAVLGVYGVVAHAFRARSFEMGVRMALGAHAAHVRGLAARHAALLAGAGILLGAPAAVTLHGLARALLYGQPPFSWWMLSIVGALVLVTSLVASLIPAARAARLEPATVLRDR